MFWYLDTLGFRTGGYGHLYKKGDPESFDQGQADDWLTADIGAARKAAQKQFDQLPYQTQSLYDVLVSVNFQLGVAWNRTFKKTWKYMLDGEYNEAAIEAQRSTWYNQTPVRVRDLQKALFEAAILARSYKDLGL